ncbi:MAG: hypothetical protein ACF8XB_03525 [Planctomycetota bacterium JB042]
MRLLVRRIRSASLADELRDESGDEDGNVERNEGGNENLNENEKRSSRGLGPDEGEKRLSAN